MISRDHGRNLIEMEYGYGGHGQGVHIFYTF